MRLQCRFRRRHGSVSRPDAGAAGAGHGEDTTAVAHQLASDQVLHPIDETVRHDIHRHIQMRLGDRVGRRFRNERLERPERQRMEQHAHHTLAPSRLEPSLDLVQNLLTLFCVGRVGVKEHRLTTGGLKG